MDEHAAIPNAPFTWGPQPYKGLIFLATGTQVYGRLN